MARARSSRPVGWCYSIILVALAGMVAPSARAAFVPVGQVPDVPGQGICREGSLWVTSGNGGWTVFDDSFRPLSTVSIPNVGSIRGIDFDPLADQFVFYDFDHATLYRTTPSGGVVSRWFDPVLSLVNDVSVNPLDGTVWLARFSGQVEHRTADGTLLQTFQAGFNLSGIAIDPVRNTEFLMRADGPGGAGGPFDDQIDEFTSAGVDLGTVVPASAIGGNGLTLEYLPDQGRLYVMSQLSQNIYIFEDLSRATVPEPSSFSQVLLGTVVLSAAWTVRRKIAPTGRPDAIDVAAGRGALAGTSGWGCS